MNAHSVVNPIEATANAVPILKFILRRADAAESGAYLRGLNDRDPAEARDAHIGARS
jgi:hypothetical protein